MKNVYNGVAADGSIDPSLWKKTWEEIFGSFQSGYGKSLASVEFNTPDWEYLQQLKYNTAVFTAFRQNTQIRDCSQYLFDENGNKRSWKDFREATREVNDTYNKRWLQTEYNQAHNTALQARKWRDFESTSDLYPNLTYIAVRDHRTRPEHAKLHGTTLPINHPFWNKYSPPIDWGCRCTLRRTDRKATSVPEELPEVRDGFDVNPGKQAKIFSNEHPLLKKSADQSNALVAFVNSQLSSVEEIRQSFASFNSYDEAKYVKSYFNGNTGGLVVHHKEHLFDKRYGKYEKSAMNLLAEQGKHIEALPELGAGKHIDLKIDGALFELKTMLARTDSGVKNALWEGFATGANNVILYWPAGFDRKAMEKGVGRLMGQAKVLKKELGSIYYLTEDGVLHKYL